MAESHSHITTPFGSPHSLDVLPPSLPPSHEESPHSESEADVSPRRAPISPAESEYSGFKSEEKVPRVVRTSP
jgi:hypothetical protein